MLPMLHRSARGRGAHTCTGEVCIVKGLGILTIGGTASPNFEYYTLRGVKSE